MRAPPPAAPTFAGYKQVDVVRDTGVNQSQLSQWLRNAHTGKLEKVSCDFQRCVLPTPRADSRPRA
jgi:transposase-like protein